MTDQKRFPNAVPALRGGNGNSIFEDAPETPEKKLFPFPRLKREQHFWPPKIRWARERGWLKVQDPFDGSWHEIYAKEAPTGYVRLAQIDRAERRHL